MRLFAIVVFLVHAGFEILFGLNNFISGASSSLSPEQIAALTPEMTVPYRFLGSALFALGLLGLLVVFGIGVRTAAARMIAAAFTVFHGLGSAGILIAANSDPAVLQKGFTMGALGIHGLLAVGFAIIALKGTTQD